MGCLSSKEKESGTSTTPTTSTTTTTPPTATQTPTEATTTTSAAAATGDSSAAGGGAAASAAAGAAGGGGGAPGGVYILSADGTHRGCVEDKYEMGAELGRGGFAVVYEGRNKETGEAVAVKVIEKKFVDPNELQCLVREIDIMKKVEHPNVLRLIDIFENETSVIMIIELVTGGELFYKIVERGSYSEADAANIVRQLLTGVQYLHKQGIAHRDLKPENLLCSGDGPDMVIKIADFGLSKAFSSGEVLKTSCGTPDYAAPEVLRMEGTYSNAVDMWSVGVITYVLLCGYPPFYAKEQRELFNQILNADYDFPEEDWDKISDEAKDFIRSLLKVDTEERLTADQALEHPWVKNAAAAPAGEAAELHLGKHLNPYIERRKAQAA